MQSHDYYMYICLLSVISLSVEMALHTVYYTKVFIMKYQMKTFIAFQCPVAYNQLRSIKYIEEIERKKNGEKNKYSSVTTTR